MQRFAKILLTVFLASSNFLDVRIYEDGCQLTATYTAEQVVVNADEAYMDLYFENGDKLHIPFRFGVQEVQVAFQQYFRSYRYDKERKKIYEKREPLCTGSI